MHIPVSVLLNVAEKSIRKQIYCFRTTVACPNFHFIASDFSYNNLKSRRHG